MGFSIFKSMNRFAVFLFLLLLIGCKDKSINLGKDISFDKQMDISYGKDSDQKLDLYVPKNKDSIKGIFVIIHGGGWKSGDKSQLSLFTLSLMQKLPNYVFANINYRLASENSFGIPNQTDDIENVIFFLEKELGKKSNIILLGNSAGAHLAMLYSYKFNNNFKIKAVVNIVGPSDLADSNFKNYSDYTFVENHLVNPVTSPACISKTYFASPTKWIDEKSPPTISFYGDNDGVIPLSQKAILDSALNNNKINNQSYLFSGGHLDWTNEKNAPFLINKIDEFLKQVK